MYKVYGKNKKSGWEMISEKKDYIEAIRIADKLKAEEYYKYLIKESDWQGDRIIERKPLFEEMER